MSPHNTRYKNKPIRVEVAAKFSPINLSNQMQKTKATSTSKMSSASKISSASPSSSPPTIPAASPSAPSGEISKPKRPLSSYNLFFKHMRDEMLASTSSSGSTTYDHSKHATTLQSPSARRDLSKKGRPPPHRKIGFAEMARQIGAKWKALDGDRREHFESLARIDKQRYLREMEAWKAAGGDTGTASPTGASSKPLRKVAAPKKSPKKSPPSSPKSKKSKTKAPKIDDLKEAATSSSIAQPAQPEEIYSHEDYVSYTIGAPSSSTQQQQRRLSANAYDNVLGALDRASRHSSTNSIASTQYDSTGSTASGNESYKNYDYTSGQQQQSRTYHHDFQPPMAARRVSEDINADDSNYLYSGHYNGYNQGHYNRYYLAAPPSYDPYQQVAPSHRREITCDDGRNLPASPDRRQFEQAGKISRRSSSNWNATMVEPIVCDKIPSSSIDIEVDFKNQEPKWSDFDDADRLLDVLGKLDEDDDCNPPIVEPSPPLEEAQAA